MHIPKTAGTSFRAALEAEYGDQLTAVYDGARPNGRTVRAVHGHFSPPQFWSAGRKAKLIMWMRDPVERLASYYDFWSGTEAHGNPNHDRFLTMGMSFVEFAEWAPIRDEFAEMYVADMTPDDFFFVGITERYSDDLARLADMLGWRSAAEPARANVTPERSATIDDETRNRIEEIHAVEVDWYRRFC